LEIDAQSHPVVLSEQPDDHASGRRTMRIGDGENAAALERPQNPLEMSELGGGYEEDLTFTDLRDAGIALDREQMPVDALSAHHVIEIAAEGILAQHPDHERCALLRQ